MLGYLPAVFLLIGVILASCEITLPDVTEVETSIDDRNGLSYSNTWQKEPLVMGEIEERIDPNHETDATDEQKNVYLGHPDRRIDVDTDSRGVSKRRANLDTWLDLSAKSKELRNLPSSQRRRKKKKKTTETTPWIYRLGNKRTESADEAGSMIRTFRVPFNSWGGKRGSMTFSALQENMYDRYGRDLSVDGNDVKKKAEDIERVRGKLPFNSWGGKRSEKSTVPGYLMYLKERVYGVPVLRVYKAYESTKGRNNGKNGEKENDNFMYRIPNHRYNETSQDDSSDDVNGRPILEKREKYHEICKKNEFNPWGGKRSSKPDDYRSDKTVAFLAYIKGSNTFLCCYPIKETKY